jgi:ADP-heptose:LPS heptosyltransferase
LTSLYAAASGAAQTVGFNTKAQFRHYPFDYAIDHRDDRHQLENLRELLVPLGIMSTRQPSLVAKGNGILDIPSRSFVVFHPWPGGYRARSKCWPNSHWIELGKRVNEAGCAVVLTGGPNDAERSAIMAGSLLKAGVDVYDYAAAHTLMETAVVLRKSVAVISVDTGIMHVAAALGVPTIGLHGPTRSGRWGAVGPYVRSINAVGDDCGFLSLGFEHPKNPPSCMERISPEDVFHVLKEFLVPSGISTMQLSEA